MAGTRVLLGADERGSSTGSSGRPWWRGAAVAGGAFVLLLVLAVAFHTGGDHGAGDGNGNDGGGDAVRANVAGPTADGPVEENAAGGDDPPNPARHTAHGVPVGYPRSQEGAVQAAVNYQLARSSAEYFTDAAARHRVMGAMASTETREPLTRNDDEAVSQVLASLNIDVGTEADEASADTLVARAAPLGTRVGGYSDQIATVEVWMAGLIGTTADRAPLPVSASWSTHTLTLRWQDDDWKLVSSSSTPGPTPLETGGNAPSSVADFRTADEEFDAPPYVG
ncbi:hypothetical protein ACTWP5_31290 [Streptomyces sp. 4N509B]|uniref:hypothetical protein n=1 Tax=Streptomyces sp. 4N509B TaxID=3457413 RepID=UPI003FD3F8C0